MIKPSQATQALQQPGIRALGKRCAAVNGVNLGQGICDLPTPDLIKQQALDAIKQGNHTYSACEGILPLRAAIAEKLIKFNAINADPEQEIIVSHGSTGAFVSAVQTVFNPGDEVILFEPFYSYHKHILELFGIGVKTVSINLHDFSVDYDQLRASISTRTKGIVICTPNNPTGKVYTQAELLILGEIAEQHNLVLITDEIYEYITYPGHKHVSLASLKNFKDRTITISGFSKTYNMTGWRLGYATGPANIIEKMTLVQDLLYICPTVPLQHAVIAALQLEQAYYRQLSDDYRRKKETIVTALQAMNFKVSIPQGAYYLLADISALDFADDVAAVNNLLEKAQVACVTGRSFFSDPNAGKHLLRFCFAIDDSKITRALENMEKVLR